MTSIKKNTFLFFVYFIYNIYRYDLSSGANHLLNMDIADPTQALQTDIRKLQLELMRQELNDKMLTLKLYLERKKQQNATTLATTTVDPRDKFEMKPFNSILFLNVVGEFEVWHFIVITLLVWCFILVAIKYMCKFVHKHRAKRRRRNSIKLKKELKRKQRMNKNSQISTLSSQKSLDESSCTKKPFSYNNEDPNTTLDTLNNQTSLSDMISSTTQLFQNKSIEYFMPPKRDFFLYTIHEHEIQAKKVFTFRKKEPCGGVVSNLKTLTESLSKSDSNLAKTAKYPIKLSS